MQLACESDAGENCLCSGACQKTFHFVLQDTNDDAMQKIDRHFLGLSTVHMRDTHRRSALLAMRNSLRAQVLVFSLMILWPSKMNRTFCRSGVSTCICRNSTGAAPASETCKPVCTTFRFSSAKLNPMSLCLKLGHPFGLRFISSQNLSAQDRRHMWVMLSLSAVLFTDGCQASLQVLCPALPLTSKISRLPTNVPVQRYEDCLWTISSNGCPS